MTDWKPIKGVMQPHVATTWNASTLHVRRGRFQGAVRIGAFEHPGLVVKSDGIVQIEFLFRTSDNRLFSCRSHAGPHDFFFPDRFGRRAWPRFEPDLTITACVDWREDLAIRFDDGSSSAFRLKYFEATFGLMISEGQLVIRVGWRSESNGGRLDPDEDGEGFHGVLWDRFLWRETYREFSRGTEWAGPRSVLDVVEWEGNAPTGVSLPALDLYVGDD